jgi:signal transduction histidine kinase/ActR/RegA family two-component response regulator
MAVSAVLITLLGVLALRTAYRRVAEVTESQQALSAVNKRLIAEGQEREAAEAQLRQMQKMESMGQLTGGIAHDFNNMLAIVIGSLDIARRRLAPDADPRVAKSIGNAAEGAQRAAQLTARLLAFSRQQPLDPQPTDVNKLVGGMSELLRRTIGESIRVETVLAGGLWRASIDASQLESAIINLCVNSRDAMPTGGRLTIETANAHLDDAYAAAQRDVVAGQYVMVSVTDSGTGMPRDVVERAFDPFFTTKGVGKGTGLGLSQVFGFIKQSRGHVKIYSEPGEGTVIKIYMPRYYGAEAAVGMTVAAPAELPRAQGEEIILVVEDEERVRHMTVDSLRELGYTIVQASDGEQALEILAIQPRIDMLFTDIVMPGINGRELADRARETDPDLKILYTTGYTRNAIVHNGMLDPGLSFLAKPFTLDQLAMKVRQVLDAGRVEA